MFTNRPRLYMNIQPFDASLIGLCDMRWKEVRSILSPVFSTSKLKLMKSIFEKKVDAAVDIVSGKAQRNEMFNIYTIFQGLTLDTISACALAMKTRCLEKENDPLMVSMRKFVHEAHTSAITLGIMFPILETIFTFIVNNLNQHSQLNSLIVGNLHKVINERRMNPDLRSMDVLQLMLDSSEEDSKSSTKLTTKEVVANAFLVVIGGYETTSTALAFTLYLLVKHPDIQERLFEEIDQAPDTNYTTLQELRYLDQVFEESLRMYPPVTGLISRECREDYNAGTYTFPKESIVLVPIWQLQHDPELFPDPWNFDPDRFSPENKNRIKSMSYLPFGEGPRNCIGSRFAQLEAKLTLFKLIKKFKFVPCEKTEDNITIVCPTLACNPKNGVWLRALPR
nr:cytochrome P450 3A19-like [Parasteatoda tepidariorum]